MDAEHSSPLPKQPTNGLTVNQ